MIERLEEAARRAHPPPMPKAEAWIREHGAAYVGQWVALHDDELIAAAHSFTELKRQLPPNADVLLTVIE